MVSLIEQINLKSQYWNRGLELFCGWKGIESRGMHAVWYILQYKVAENNLNMDIFMHNLHDKWRKKNHEIISFIFMEISWSSLVQWVYFWTSGSPSPCSTSSSSLPHFPRILNERDMWLEWYMRTIDEEIFIYCAGTCGVEQ